LIQCHVRISIARRNPIIDTKKPTRLLYFNTGRCSVLK
jgi:hypothetical protein